MKPGNHAFRSVTSSRSTCTRAQRSTTRSLDIPLQPAYLLLCSAAAGQYMPSSEGMIRKLRARERGEVSDACCASVRTTSKAAS